MMTSHLMIWALLTTSVGVSVAAPSVHAAEVRPAERLHDAAVQAYRKGKLRQAVELWRDALKLEPSWKYA